MTTYDLSKISDTAIAHKKGITLQQGRTLRDNPIAMAEGAANAPVVAAGWHPYNKVTVGDMSDGKIYDFAVHGAQLTVETPDYADGYEYMLFADHVHHDLSTVQQLVCELYRQTDADWSTVFTTTRSTSGSWTLSAYVHVQFPRIANSYHVAKADVMFQGGAYEGLADQVYDATVQKIQKTRLSWTGGAKFEHGAIYLWRRREYVSG